MVKLIIGIHNHQPVGNFGYVLEQAYKTAYLPFIQTLRGHPNIKVSIHFSGILYDWFETEHPEYLKILEEMAKAGQIEILAGGYYEPILALLPRQDQKGQISKMRHYIRKRFGVQPAGAWLAERVWEPELASVLNDSAIEYTVLDDVHFTSVGFRREELTGYFTAEYSGKHVAVFPINQELRYLMPFADPEKTIEYLRRFEGQQDTVLVMADDGEKFGLWPKTYDLVYQRRWLDRMFTLLEQNSSWLKTCTFSECKKSSPSKGLAYLPTTSYYELSQWALPADASADLERLYKSLPDSSRRFLRGGYFRNFLSKYPEANRMYRKMLRVSSKVHANPHPSDAALEPLWMSQCNCGYWHGVFGGLYLPHIRSANYANMLKAELAASKQEGFSFEHEDWDGDGRNEVLAETNSANWYFSPSRGGSLWEWDWKKAGINWINILSRRKESYHSKVSAASIGESAEPDAIMAKEAGLEEHICYDWHDRACLLDHFLHPNTTPEDFAKARYGEQGDFVTAEYAARHSASAAGAKLTMERTGTVWSDNSPARVEVSKTITMNKDGSWSADYCITNLDQDRRELWFGTELAFGFLDGNVCGKSAKYSIQSKTFNDPRGALAIESDKHFNLWTFPLNSVSLSEGGFEKTYQGTVMLCHHKLSLNTGESFAFQLRIGVIRQ